MRAIMVMYDTLCRNFLAPYGCDWVKTPNFTRLAERSVTFDTNYVCSLPCMPARRDLHNGRVNFLQRDWGPLEPYDDSVPELMKNNGIYTALISDHYHYWEDGGCTYHNRYNSWIAHRGQEGDSCRGDRRCVHRVSELGSRVQDPQQRNGLTHLQDEANRDHCRTELDMPQAKTFRDGLAFLEENRDEDNWFLQIETFDPHEPFFTQPEWREKYPELAAYVGSKTDWPGYEAVRPGETAEDIRYVRTLYAAIVTMCDSYLGKVLDCMDRYDLWKDTLLIVNTDHGFLLGEHDWWGKSIMPAYEEISHTPLFIYDPVSGLQGERRNRLTSAIDLPATLLDFFGLPKPPDLQGESLLPVIRENRAVRASALFGFHAGITAITDGEYTYFRAPLTAEEQNCYDYTLMPTRMRERFSVEDLRKAELAAPLPNSKGCPVLKVPARISYISPVNFGTKLFRVTDDPRQAHPLDDPETEARLSNLLAAELIRAGAPEEQFVRMGLKPDGSITGDEIRALHASEEAEQTPDVLPGLRWSPEARNVWRAFAKLMPPEGLNAAGQIIGQVHAAHADEPVSSEDITAAVKRMLPPDQQQQILYFLLTVSRAD